MYLKLHSNKMYFVYVMSYNGQTVVKLREASERGLDIYVAKCQRRSLQVIYLHITHKPNVPN
jgi:hypothetical protein